MCGVEGGQVGSGYTLGVICAWSSCCLKTSKALPTVGRKKNPTGFNGLLYYWTTDKSGGCRVLLWGLLQTAPQLV